MYIDKAIELLSDSCDRGGTTLDNDFKEAVIMGKMALIGIKRIPGVHWDGASVAALADISRVVSVRAHGNDLDLCCETPSCGGVVRATSCESCGTSCQGCTPVMGLPGRP